MVRFLHTADWQIGMKAAFAGEKAEALRQARLDAGNSAVAVATGHNVDFVLIAGDLFENNAVSPVAVQRTIEVLSKAPCPVFVLPGNHDPLRPGSAYHLPAWERAAPKVTVLRTCEPLPVGEAVLYPCPLTEKSGRRDPTEWIPAQGDGIRIGVAHGSLRVPERFQEEDFPISLTAASDHGLDYLALGHWHSRFEWADERGVVRTVYPGTPEPAAFDERDSGTVSIVEIEARGAAPRLLTVPTGKLRWTARECELTTLEEAEALVAELQRWEAAESSCLRLNLKGVVDESVLAPVDELEMLVEARFLFGEVLRDQLLLWPSEDDLVNAMGEGHLGEVARELLMMQGQGEAGRLPAEVSPEVVSEALALLYRIAKEARA